MNVEIFSYLTSEAYYTQIVEIYLYFNFLNIIEIYKKKPYITLADYKSHAHL